jgi:hypothetical protein
LEMLAAYVEMKARKCAEGRDFAFGEMWKVITSHHLHGNTDAWHF